MREWRFFINDKVLQEEGQKLSAGNIIMGNHSFQTCERSLDSDFTKLPIDLNQVLQKPNLLSVQSAERITLDIEASGKDLRIALLRNRMFDAPSLNKWGIFYQARDHVLARNFVSTT